MSTKKIIIHRTPADGNIFVDLGFGTEEAAKLLAEADLAIDQGAPFALRTPNAQSLQAMIEAEDIIKEHRARSASAREKQ